MQLTVATAELLHLKFFVTAVENLVVVRDAIVIYLITCFQMIPMNATLVSIEIQIMSADTVLIA